MRRRCGGDAPIRGADERDESIGEESEIVRNSVQLEEVNPGQLPRAARAVLLGCRRRRGGGMDVNG